MIRCARGQLSVVVKRKLGGGVWMDGANASVLLCQVVPVFFGFSLGFGVKGTLLPRFAFEYRIAVEGAEPRTPSVRVYPRFFL